jgi:hypothetical protein
VKSGWHAARREFGYDLYDGFTGLVTQPVGGWRDEVTMPAKVAGAAKGMAKGEPNRKIDHKIAKLTTPGLSGVVLKSITAVG